MDRRLARLLRRVLPEAVLRPPERGVGRRSARSRATSGYLEALNAYQQGQVLGYYNSQNEELVYTGDAEPRPDRAVRAGARAHARDRRPALRPRPAGRHGRSGATTRSSRRRSASWRGAPTTSRRRCCSASRRRRRARSPATVGRRGAAPDHRDPGVSRTPRDSGSSTPSPIRAGRRRSTALCETFPTTTEQVLHPSKFPGEVAETVDVPDFAPTFGPTWRDLDVMVVGELWLKALLHLRLDERRGGGGRRRLGRRASTAPGATAMTWRWS